MTFNEEFLGLVFEVTEVPGESNVEAATRQLFADGFNALTIVQKLQSDADAGDNQILDVSRSLTQLAKQFNNAFKSLTPDQKAEIKAVVAGIVTGSNETDAENYFNAVLDMVQSAQTYVAELTVLLETPVDEG